jgi:ADP-heptose:LPS heptosyltransferase
MPDKLRDRARSSYFYARDALRILIRLLDLYATTLPFRYLPRASRRIAVLRADNIGDFVLWLDGARAIRRGYPKGQYHLTLVAAQKWKAFAESSGQFDDIIAVDPKRFDNEAGYRRKLCLQLASRRFKIAINPTYSRSAWVDDLLVKATGASTSIGHLGDLANQPSPWVKRLTDRWYTDLTATAASVTHEIEKNWMFSKKFDPAMMLRVPVLEQGMVRRPAWFEDRGDYIVIFIGAESPIRRWPAERFGEIARRLHAKVGWSAIVCGLESDSDMAQQIVAQYPDIPVLNACGQTTLHELAYIIAGARLVVTNDTSAAHLAAALKRKAVVVLGGGQFGRFLPYPIIGNELPNVRAIYHSMPCFQCKWICIHPRGPNDPGPCVAQVSIDDVWASIVLVLAATTTGQIGSDCTASVAD